MFDPVSTTIDFPAGERKILAFWKEAGIFEKSLKHREGAETFVFFEGPPTANGTPHNGHVLTRVIKDVFPRYKTMRGYRVPRKAGWDTHGLPVEVEVEKSLGIHGKEAIEAYGVEAFTRKCVDSVFEYTDVWQDLTERIGFWVDLETAYVTYHKSYVESVWWALSQLFEKGLLYKGHKVVWWWPQGGTALSSGEVGQGYREVDDPSIYAKFKVAGSDSTWFLGWTTTPWTLPSNCALAVHPKLEYAFAKVGDDTFIVARDLCDGLFGEGGYEVLETRTGDQLVGTRYEPLFNYATPEGGRSWEVIAADFVTASATGVVHTAPAFGEDDFRVCKASGIGMLQLVAPDGRFVPAVTDFAGRFCKEADRDIIRHLKEAGRLFKQETYRHDYPFCWRAKQDPLIQYARPAWFIRTTAVIERAIANNREINWYPPHIKEGRFGDFLANNVDWALSRERYWGTPLNIWQCEACEARKAPASVAAIEEANPSAFDAFREAQAADPSLNDHLVVHKPWIDQVTMPCEGCGGTMRRVPEVIDCWFDSGCMPFAQWGYPHQGKDDFAEAFPADFISEAIDQTRGWFYSLLMVSTLLFDDGERALPHPFKNCIVLGHVTDPTGKKESKSLGNYTAPDQILDSDGADAMRWYFYAANPPHNNTRYSAEAVRQGQQEFLLKLRNVYSFFVIYANIDGFAPETSPRREPAERSLLDRWMLSELHLTVREVTARMDDYGVYEAAQAIVRLADGLSNWFVRRSRDRFWSKVSGDATADADKWDAYHTLYELLTTLAKVAAPFVPFISEDIYRNLVVGQVEGVPESVHLGDWPDVEEALIDEALSEEMQAVRDIVSLGLKVRASHKLRVRQPLHRAEIILGHAGLTARMQSYEALIAEELNVKAVEFTQQAAEFVDFTVKPNYRALGPVFGKRMPLVRKALDAVDPADVRGALAAHDAYAVVLADGETVTLTSEHVQVSVDAHEGYAASGSSVGVVVLETTLDAALIAEGKAREVVSRIQAWRKEQDLAYTQRISCRWHTADPELASALEAHAATIARETLATAFNATDKPAPGALATSVLGVDLSLELTPA